jgi:hypothetical protein
MTDTDKHERVEARLRPEVIEWAANMVKAARAHKTPPEVVADFERLLAWARGEAATPERVIGGEHGQGS